MYMATPRISEIIRLNGDAIEGLTQPSMTFNTYAARLVVNNLSGLIGELKPGEFQALEGHAIDLTMDAASFAGTIAPVVDRLPREGETKPETDYRITVLQPILNLGTKAIEFDFTKANLDDVSKMKAAMKLAHKAFSGLLYWTADNPKITAKRECFYSNANKAAKRIQRSARLVDHLA